MEEYKKRTKQRYELKLQIEADMKDPDCDLTWKYNMWPRPMKIDPFTPLAEPPPNLPVRFPPKINFILK